MPKNTRIGSDLGLAALMSLVADHGDSLHYSLSKRGRVWLTLTHYEGERYATSVELSALSDTGDLRTAAVVVAAAHTLKCFGPGGHSDTWLTAQAAADTYEDAYDTLEAWVKRGAAQVAPDEAGPTT